MLSLSAGITALIFILRKAINFNSVLPVQPGISHTV